MTRIDSKLEKIVKGGKTWLYKASHIVILRIEKIEAELVYKITAKTDTSERTFVIKNDKIKDFIEDLLPVDSKPNPLAAEGGLVSKKAVEPDMLMGSGKAFEFLAKGLLEDFARIEKDESYINKAKQRAKTTNTILQIAKVQLDYEKLENNK
jgi:hypothetical protein